METNLFGDAKIKEESFEIIYKGSSFSGGEILISDLYLELQSLESLLRDSVKLLVRNGKLNADFKNFQIFIEIEKGSLWEKIKIKFANPIILRAFEALVIPFLVVTYDHFLRREPGISAEKFKQEIEAVKVDQQFKNNLKSILSPLNNNDDNLIINNGTMNFNINYYQKGEIIQGLERTEEEVGPLKNGEFKEELVGVVRKLDLDATSYLGFNIDNGPSRIPTLVRGEFNLNDIKEIINERIKINAMVRYKDDEIKHIEILDYILLAKQEKLDL